MPLTYEQYKSQRFIHIPTGKVYKHNGSNGLTRAHNPHHDNDFSLPIWLTENSLDWEVGPDNLDIDLPRP